MQFLAEEDLALGGVTPEALASRQALTEKGQPNGYAALDSSGEIPNAQLPPGLAVQPVVRDYTVPGPIAVGSGVLSMVMPTDYQDLLVTLAGTGPPVGQP